MIFEIGIFADKLTIFCWETENFCRETENDCWEIEAFCVLLNHCVEWRIIKPTEVQMTYQRRMHEMNKPFSSVFLETQNILLFIFN